MKDEEMAEEYTKNLLKKLGIKEDMLLENQPKYLRQESMNFVALDVENVTDGFLAGLKAGRPQWHKVVEGDPYNYEYWDLPQDKLPKIEDFYFVKLKNGFIKICELKYDHWSGKKHFYDLHGGKQSNVAEWLDYPTFDKE